MVVDSFHTLYMAKSVKKHYCLGKKVNLFLRGVGGGELAVISEQLAVKSEAGLSFVIYSCWQPAMRADNNTDNC